MTRLFIDSGLFGGWFGGSLVVRFGVVRASWFRASFAFEVSCFFRRGQGTGPFAYKAFRPGLSFGPSPRLIFPLWRHFTLTWGLGFSWGPILVGNCFPFGVVRVVLVLVRVGPGLWHGF